VGNGNSEFKKNALWHSTSRICPEGGQGGSDEDRWGVLGLWGPAALIETRGQPKAKSKKSASSKAPLAAAQMVKFCRRGLRAIS